MATSLQSVLEELTTYPSTEFPLLSIYLDWTTDGNGQRPSLRTLEQELAAIGGSLADSPAARASFEADQQRIMDFLSREAPTDARGLAIFACDAEGIWQALPLQAPIGTQVSAGRYPRVFELARAIDDYETCAVVLAEGQQATIFVIALDQLERVGETEAAEKIKRFDQGGQAQMLFQRRTENIVRAHTKDIAAELDRIVRRYDAQHIVLAGNDSIKGHLLGSLPEQLKAKLIDYVHLDINSNAQAIREVVEPMLREVERKQETDALAELELQLTAKGGLAVAGAADVAMALAKGQVATLLMLPSFGGAGGECPNCGTLRAGQRQKCPYDGAELQPVELREAFTARAIQQGSAVEIVEQSDDLAGHGGVAALLRYRDDLAQTVGDGHA